MPCSWFDKSKLKQLQFSEFLALLLLVIKCSASQLRGELPDHFIKVHSLNFLAVFKMLTIALLVLCTSQ